MKKSKKEKYLAMILQPGVQALKSEIFDFRRNLVDSNGVLPRQFKYPKDIVQRVSDLKHLGLSSGIVAEAIGVSPAGVRNWFKLSRPRAGRRPSAKLARELKIETAGGQFSQPSQARIILGSGIIIEMNVLSITTELLKELNSSPLSPGRGMR